MIQYRRYGRTFCKVNGDLVIRVTNLEKASKIDISENWMVRVDCLDENTKEATELEFNAAFKEAYDRISLQRL